MRNHDISLFFFNLFFIGVQFTNIQNNTQCPSPIHSHPPPSSPSNTPSSFPRVSSLYVLSPFLIFPTHFFSLPLFSLSLLFIFPKWMRLQMWRHFRIVELTFALFLKSSFDGNKVRILDQKERKTLMNTYNASSTWKAGTDNK